MDLKTISCLQTCDCVSSMVWVDVRDSCTSSQIFVKEFKLLDMDIVSTGVTRTASSKPILFGLTNIFKDAGA